MSAQKRRTALRAAGIIVGAVLVWAVIAATDIDSLIAQMKTVGWFFFAAIGVTLCSQFIAVVAWYKSFFTPLHWSALFHLFNIRLVGESLAQINPASVIAGETIKGYLLKNKLGITYIEGAVSLLLSRIMIVMSSAALLIFGTAIVFQRLAFGRLQAVSIGVCAITALLIFLFVRALRTGRGFLGWLAPLLKKLFVKFRFADSAAEGLLKVDGMLVEFYGTRRRDFYAVFFLSVLHRIIGSLEYYVILYALGIDVAFVSCVLFDLVSMLLRLAGFFIPGQIGLDEFGNKLMFSIVNIPGTETWITVSLVRRGRQIFWILIGFVIYLFLTKGSGIKGGTKEDADENAFCNP